MPGVRRPSRCRRTHHLHGQRVVLRRDRETDRFAQRREITRIPRELLGLGELGEERSAFTVVRDVHEGELEPSDRGVRFEQSHGVLAGRAGVLVTFAGTSSPSAALQCAARIAGAAPACSSATAIRRCPSARRPADRSATNVWRNS